MHCLKGLWRTTESCNNAKSFIRFAPIGRQVLLSHKFHRQAVLRQTSNDNLASQKEDVVMSKSRDIISVSINNDTLKYPSIWLRDNCQCPGCFHKTSQSRTIDWSRFEFNVEPLSAKLESSNLTIEWSDNHKSIFSLAWLIQRSFTEEKRKSYRDNVYRFKRVPWGANEFQQCLKTFDYQDLMKDNSLLLKWLESLTRYGVAMVEGAPSRNDSCKKLTERVSFVRKTHYGEEFIVTAKDSTSNVAYLSAPLQLHTDLPYYHYKPGTNLLHCLIQTQGEGGENQLTDCLHVANYLKLNDPATYKILTSTFVDWNDIGQEDGNHFHSIHQAPVLCEDDYGDVVRVNYSQPQRDSHFNVPLEKVIPWYRAMGVFTKLLHNPENTVFFKLKQGEILTFDNLRLVHGRTGYKDHIGKERNIIGCYLDWDEIYSRIRVLQKGL